MSRAPAILTAPLAPTETRDKAGPLPWSLRSPAISAFALIAADLVALLASAYVAVELRDMIWGHTPYPLGLREVGAGWIILRFWSGLYPGFGLTPVEELQRAVTTTGLAALGHAAALFAVQGEATSRFILLLTWCAVVLGSWMLRGLSKAILIRFRRFGAPIIVVGGAESGGQLIAELKANPALGLVPVAVFDDDAAGQGQRVADVPVLGSVQAALEAQFPYPVRHAVVAIPTLAGRRLTALTRTLSARYLNLAVLTDLSGLVDLSLRPRAFGNSLGLEVRNNLLSPLNTRLKRYFDLLLSIPLALLTFPLVLAAALAVKLASPGPAFFGQEREGRRGRRVRVWKIRTMVPHAERILERYLAENPEAQAEWARHMKLRHDPRVVPVVGHFLRRFSIDELPQLWNVLRGEMSLVGPRPFPRYHLEQFPEEFLALRRQALPGMTGLWQITSRSEGDLKEQERADTYYTRNWTLWIDLWIVLCTARTVSSGKGAH